MKKAVLFLCSTLFSLTACQTSKLSVNGDTEKQFTATYINYMDHANGPKYKKLMDGLSPEYIKKNDIDKEKYKVNNYSVWGFSIDSYDNKEGLIVTKIWGEEKRWMHRLTFKIVKEKGKMYMMPSKHSDAYIDPWYKVDTYIKE
ncbi:MAG: hypothetical protein PHR81_02555 [Bacteroidales bacterium]|jgi:hypothetical protein|nr:hypothetical protein [Bacteroidales bacterium]MDD4213672.1 hypothetical protein [Bacteroidales bacterium]